ncbi:MAG: hypothetical protein ACTSXX_02150 [Candidatus Baldrarchaeia archaeon]
MSRASNVIILQVIWVLATIKVHLLGEEEEKGEVMKIIAIV